jgi:uncharacterized phage protein gp47/JayE
MQECLALAPAGIDLRQGGIFYDAVASACVKIAQYYADLSTVFDLVFVTTAVDEYLDRKGSEYGVFRIPATSARYEYFWTGATEPLPGERFFTEGLYFTLMQAEDLSLYLEADSPGAKSNNIIAGTPAVPMANISGLTSSTFGALIEPGADTESDEQYRERIQEKIAGPAENGNKQHYKTWCESIPGVGRARIIPLFAGENTVMGVIIGVDGLPAAQAVVDRVQEYVDPMTLGLTVDVDGEIIPVGDGLGDGVANIGAHFAAVSPTAVPIDISFSVELKPGATVDQIKADAIVALTAYLKGLALTTPERQEIVVRVSAISSILYALPGLIDYTDLTLNGAPGNIALTDRQVAALGEVDVSAII